MSVPSIPWTLGRSMTNVQRSSTTILWDMIQIFFFSAQNDSNGDKLPPLLCEDTPCLFHIEMCPCFVSFRQQPPPRWWRSSDKLLGAHAMLARLWFTSSSPSSTSWSSTFAHHHAIQTAHHFIIRGTSNSIIHQDHQEKYSQQHCSDTVYVFMDLHLGRASNRIALWRRFKCQQWGPSPLFIYLTSIFPLLALAQALSCFKLLTWRFAPTTYSSCWSKRFSRTLSNCLQNNPNHAYSCLGFKKLFNVLLSCIGREASWPMRNIETFPSKQMYLYLSLAKRNEVETYHNIDRRRYLVRLKWIIFITIWRELLVSLIDDVNRRSHIRMTTQNWCEACSLREGTG